MTCSVCDSIKEKKNLIYEDEKIIALLSETPAAIGHVLIMPKDHFTIIEQVPDPIIGKIFTVANKISTVVFETLGMQGTNLLVNNGIVAGQESAHFMVHIIPRRTNDGLNLEWKPKEVPEDELSTLELQIKPFTKNIGLPEKEKEKPIEVHEEKETIDEENYLTKQLRRIP